MGIASSDKNTIRKMSEIEAVIYDRFLQKSAPTRRLNIIIRRQKLLIIPDTTAYQLTTLGLLTAYSQCYYRYGLHVQIQLKKTIPTKERGV